MFEGPARMLPRVPLWLLTGLAWRSGNALCPINEVARAGLVLGSVTACGQINLLFGM